MLDPKPITIARKIVLGLMLSSFATSAFSADEYDSRYANWYQVELLIFERTQYKTGESPELWPHNIDLRYPEHLEFLFTPEEWEEFTYSQMSNSIDDDSFALDSEENTMQTSAYAEEMPTANTVSDLPEMEKAFLKLERKHKELTQEAQKLKNRNQYRVLFHESWRQPMKEKQQSPSLVILGGEQFDKHSELEGTIKISVNRYLHIDTNLWKTHYEVNYGQSPGYWPMPPSVPEPSYPDLFEQDLTNEETFLSESDEPKDTAFNSNKLYSNSSGSNESNSNFNLNFKGGDSIINSKEFNYYGETNNEKTSNGEDTTFELNSYEALTKAPYVVKEIIKLQQKRRMRSNELHYIDHPRLGLLIKIKPYEVKLEKTKENPNAPLEPQGF